jgi:hypothetical protein
MIPVAGSLFDYERESHEYQFPDETLKPNKNNRMEKALKKHLVILQHQQKIENSSDALRRAKFLRFSYRFSLYPMLKNSPRALKSELKLAF